MPSITKKDIETRISPDLLDTIGRSFKFRHGKGIAEWLKNSLDAYIRRVVAREETLAGRWPAILWIHDGAAPRQGASLAVIDFGGTDYAMIKDFLLHWGDTAAAAQGNAAARAVVTGGHGNGGKFYMREMWRGGARFMTWRRGLSTSLIVDKAKPRITGYWEWENVEVPDWREALRHALSEAEGFGPSAAVCEAISILIPRIAEEVDQGLRGLTVVAGRRAQQLASSNDVVRGKRWDIQRLLDDVRTAPQSRRPLSELSVAVFHNGTLLTERLQPYAVEEDPQHPLQTWELPGSLLGSTQRVIGSLVLRQSSTQLLGKLKEQNSIAVLDGSDNPVSTYRLSELALPNSPLLRFFFGELSLDFPALPDLVPNDRDHLIPSPATTQILDFVSERIRAHIEQLEEAERQARRHKDLDAASMLNESLNLHARKFLEKLQTEITVKFVLAPDGGGPGPLGVGSGAGQGPRTDHQGETGRGGGAGAGGTIEQDGSERKVRRPRFPAVLLSGYDENPATPGNTKDLTKMHPPLYQDDEDRAHNVWWINSSHPFATAALERGGAEGQAFRSHQLFMFRDVVQREALRMIQHKEREVPLDRLETELDEISNRFLAELPMSLVNDLLGVA